MLCGKKLSATVTFSPRYPDQTNFAKLSLKQKTFKLQLFEIDRY